MTNRWQDNLAGAALVLVGHGSTVNAESSAPTYQHAGELRRRGLFTEGVYECFWKQEPFIASVVRGVAASRVFVVPLFISNGYFTEEIIPRELGLSSARDTGPRVEPVGGRTLLYCEPVGTHPAMTDVLLARAREVVEQHPFPYAPKPEEISLFVAGHGTERNENSRQAVERQADLIRARGLYASVHAVFMEEAPRIEDCYTLATMRNIVMTPFFISDGMHSHEGIPVLLGEPEATVRARQQAGQATWRNPTEKRGKRVWYSRSIGSEPRIADIILERVREAAA